MTPTNLRRVRRSALLASCASALALATAPGAAQAQALASGFQGTPSVDAGAATITTGANRTTINVGRQNTVVTWTPTSPATSGTIDFLPAGTSAAFTSTTLTDYTVLNRILPGGTATIGINGQITSTVFSPSPTPTPAPNQVPGGNVWFYTPNGFVIGPTATINVGGLLLTTNDLVYGVDPLTGAARFTDSYGFSTVSGPDGSTASIVNHGTIRGAGSDSYVAMIAPRIEQAGFVSAERSIGYFAGEDVSFLVNNAGIAVTIGRGSGDANGIVHTGTTTGTASTGSTDTKTIIFAAVPKNDAMTMLLSGSIGYAPAASAYDDGSAIVLTADDRLAKPTDVVLGEGTYSNRMTVTASGTVRIGDDDPLALEPRRYTFADLDVTGASVDLVAGPGVTVSAGNLAVGARNVDGVGGTVTVRALGTSTTLPPGSITATALSASAAGDGSILTTGLVGGAGQGGNVLLAADGGSITAGSLFVDATGYGGSAAERGGDGTGGTVTIRAGYGGAITSSFATLYASGYGAQANNGAATDVSGIGRGGTLVIADSSTANGPDAVGGTLSLGSVFLDAAAQGGQGFGLTPSGEAFGGSISIALDHASQSWTSLFASTEAVEGGVGGEGRSGRDPVGGDVNLVLDGVTLSLGGDLSLHADAVAGVNSPAGAFARGGTITVAAINGGGIAIGGNTLLSSTATVTGVGPLPNSSPDLTGGTVNVTADAGSFSTTNLTIDVSASNVGAVDSAGFSQAGTANLVATNGGTLAAVPPASGPGGAISINATAVGGDGPAPNVVNGGTIGLAAITGGTITAQSINADASASSLQFVPAVPGIGADGTGGAITVDAVGGAISSANGLALVADGTGGTGENGGGDGIGGIITTRVIQGGSLSSALSAGASGSGGTAATSGNGGIGRGGTLSFTTDPTGTTSTGFVLSMIGTGGSGKAVAGTAGDAFGGRATLDVNGGTHTWSDITLGANAYGTGGTSPTAIASSATGDPQGVRFHLGGGATMSVGDISLDSTGLTSANGGAATARGGSAALVVDGAASLSAGVIRVASNGGMLLGNPVIDAFLGGPFDGIAPADRQSTPSGIGGTASVVADSGTIVTGGLTIDAIGTTGGALTLAGVARGGSATLGALNGGAVTVRGTNPPPRISANAFGGEGPLAAHATGGTAAAYTAGGTITTTAGLAVTADALADPYAGQFSAAGIGSTGFNGQGGSASVELRTGGTGGAINAPSVTVSALGQPNLSTAVLGPGGSGTGGTAALLVAQGALTTGTIEVRADGYGGQSAADPAGVQSFQSGPGVGGTASANLFGGTVTTTGLTISANGSGADGLSGISTGTMSQASAGTGGTASLRASGGTLANSGNLSIIASGFGGYGAANLLGGTGGNGAAGTGGTATLTAPAGGAATLAITGPISVAANGFGGNGGFGSAAQGAGAPGSGGAASVSLADIPFTFAQVTVDALGAGGTGTGPAPGTGGSAAFALVDTLGSAIGPRTIGTLSLGAGGFDGARALSIGGTTTFIAQVGNAGSALTITGDMFASAVGQTGPAGNGFTGAVSGAPVAIGGQLQIITPRDGVLTIAPGAAIDVTGDITVQIGRTFTSSGLLTSAANASVVANGGIAMTDLSAGGTALLRAVGGPVSVSRNLAAGGLVTVYGTAVTINSLGALRFADADAIAGDLLIRTAGNLDLVTVDAAGAITLQSTGGTVHNTGTVTAGTDITYLAAVDAISDAPLFAAGSLTVDAGNTFSAPGTVGALGNVSLSAGSGLVLSNVQSGGTTLLRSTGGPVSVASLTSAGLVTATGQSVTIASPGALSFAQAQATAGNLQLATAGNLALAQGSATGSVTLTSSGGTVSGAGPITAGGAVAVAGATGITLGTLTSGGTTSLLGNGGPVTVANLGSAGAVTARGTAIDIGSAGALSFADLDATAGNVRVQTAGNLAVTTVDATGSITLISTGGALGIAGALNGVGFALSSLADLSIAAPLATSGPISLISTGGSVTATSPVTAGGALTVAGQTGIALGTASSGGATSLLSAAGPVTVTNLASAGVVIARGTAVDIASAGGLSFADLDATAGNVRVQTAGDLAVSTVDATGSITLVSTAGALSVNGALTGVGITLGSLANLALTAPLATSGPISLTSTGGSVSSTSPVTAGGPLNVAGQTGITLGTVGSGGATGFASAGGNVLVTALTSGGPVTATGRAVDLRSPGSLNVSSAQATGGALSLQAAGSLAIGTASATGTGSFTAGGDLATSGLVTAAGLTLSGNNVTAGGELRSSAALALTAQRLLTIGAAAAGTSVNATAGDIAIAAAGRLGQRGLTGTLTVTSINPASPMYLGGTGQSGQFSLDKAEAARLFADNRIAIVQPAPATGTAGEVLIGDWAMAYGAISSGANIGSGGTIKVDAIGRVEVGGTVAMTTVSATDTFSIDPARIDVIAGTGAIALRNAGGAPLGILELQAGTIAVADRPTLSAIAAAPSFAAIAAALDRPATPSVTGAYLQAGTINLLAGDALYIQNGGASTAFADRRGFLANALSITTSNPAPRISINGVIANAAGSLFGLDTAQAISINGVTASTIGRGPTITINGCAVGFKCAVDQFTFGGRSNDELEPLVTIGQGSSAEANGVLGGGTTGQLDQIERLEPLITPPLVDEPITGIGNDDLWQVQCDRKDDDKPCPAPADTGNPREGTE